jgi:subtilisin-like proprotein convertase family protein
MKRLVMMCCALAIAAPALAQDATGRWDLTVIRPDGQNQAILVLKKDGEKLSGTVGRPQGDSFPVSGSQKGPDVIVAFSVPTQNGTINVTLRGRQDGDVMKGSADLGDRGQAEWNAARASSTSSPAASATIDLTGTWALQVQTDAGSGTPTVTFKQEGQKLSGRYVGMFGESQLTGEVKDKAFSFNTTVSAEGNSVTITYTGTVEENALKGRVKFGDFGEGTFTGKRQAQER